MILVICMQEKLLQLDDLSEILDKADSSIILHTLEGEIIGATQAAANELGYDRDEIRQIYLANIKPKTLRLSDVCKSNKEMDSPVIFERRSGRRFPAHVNTKVLRSVFNRKTISVVQLEFEIVQGDKNQAQATVNTDIQESTGFLELLAEQFNLPASGMNILLEQLSSSGLDAEQRALVVALQQSSAELNRLNSQVVDMFRLGVNTFQLAQQPFNLIDLLDGFASNSVRCKSQGGVDVWLVVDTLLPELVFGDALRLQQVLECLQRVIASYSASTEVRLNVSFADNPEGEARIRFQLEYHRESSDTRESNRILHLLRRALTDEKTSAQIVSIDIEIARKLICLMGGELKSGVSDGDANLLEFEVNLPEVHCLDLCGNRSFLAGQRILVLEKISSLLSVQLVNWGAQVCVFQSAMEAAIHLRGQYEENAYRFLVLNNAGDLKQHENEALALQEISSIPLIVVNKIDGASYPQSAIEIPVPYSVGLLGNELAKLLETELPFPYVDNTRRRLLKDNNVNQRILLVDDSSTSRNLVTAMLNGCDYDIDLAFNGIDAVLACGQKRYDLVLMDIQMPFMDGIEAATHIRKNCDKNSTTPIVALTGDSSNNAKVALDSVGIKDVVAKPLDRSVLLHVLSAYLAGTDVSSSAVHQSSGLVNESCVDADVDYLSAKQRRSSEQPVKAISGDIVLNRDTLMRLVKDTNLLACKDMIGLFIEESALSLQGIHKGCETNDLLRIAQEAHAIKSASRTFGCDSLHDISKQLEDRAKNQKIDECLQLAKDLPEIFAGSRTLLERFNQEV